MTELGQPLGQHTGRRCGLDSYSLAHKISHMARARGLGKDARHAGSTWQMLGGIRRLGATAGTERWDGWGSDAAGTPDLSRVTPLRPSPACQAVTGRFPACSRTGMTHVRVQIRTSQKPRDTIHPPTRELRNGPGHGQRPLSPQICTPHRGRRSPGVHSSHLHTPQAHLSGAPKAARNLTAERQRPCCAPGHRNVQFPPLPQPEGRGHLAPPQTRARGPRWSCNVHGAPQHADERRSPVPCVERRPLKARAGSAGSLGRCFHRDTGPEGWGPPLSLLSTDKE